MTQENKELLLKDLCARLPYGVKVQYQVGSQLPDIKTFNAKQYDELRNGGYINDWLKCTFKPYLFPLSSMTKEQTEEVHNLIYKGVSKSVDETKEWLKTRKENELRPITPTYVLSDTLVIDWCNKNHFDYRGFIPMGLAIDATGLNIY